MSQAPATGSAPTAPTGSTAPAASAGAAVSRLHAFRLGLAAALGLAPSGGEGAEQGDKATMLAIERSYLAADRTLMAWIRTSLSMIGFGFTIGKLGQTVSEIRLEGGLRGPRLVSVEGLAYFLVILGTAALLAAILQYVVSVGEYAAMGVRRRVSISFIVGVVLFVVGGMAFTALVLQL